jgi:oxygen-independent coproporphyrinogen-3 oxidase
MLQAIRGEFALTQNVEITLEANPGTITPRSLEEYLKAGVNRLSLGVQALDEKRLSFLGRIHSRTEALEALRLARQGGFTSWSADLMFGTPLESQESWRREFDELLPQQPGGISFYSLTVEEGSLLEGRQSAGEKVSLDQDQTVELMLYAAERLQEAGYRHYEVSNWAQPGAECRHNLHYWGRGWYLGLGPSAHSFRDSRRSWNSPDIDAYTKALKAHQLPPSDSESLTADQARSEWVYLNLRQAGGLDLTEYGEFFGEAPIYWNAMLQSISQKGLGIFDAGRFTPNNRGLLLADEIAARLLG